MDRRDFLRTAGGVAGGATAATAAAGTAAAQEGGGGGTTQPVFPDYVSDAAGGEYSDERGSSEVTVEVGAGSNQVAFAPTNIWVEPGTTVNFEWVSNGHNVLPNSQPEGAGWEGSGDSLEDEGFSYSHTFETEGMYTYYCAPHEQLGMKGAVAVGTAVETETLETGSAGPQVPDSAKSLGVAAGFAMAATLGLSYLFLKYGGRGEPETGTA
jgi:halocyanin-like protein